MSNAFYSKGLEGFADGSIDWDSNNIKVVLCDASYVANVATDDNLDDIGAGARVATSGNLSSKTVTGGVLDAADVTFTALTGDEVTQIVVYKDSGVESTSRLICRMDVGVNLPLTPDGSDWKLKWSDGPYRIGRL